MTNNLPAKLTAQEAKAMLWQRGFITDFILDANQKYVRDFYKDNRGKTITVVQSRQNGKSFCYVTMAVEECLQNKDYTVCYVGPRLKQVKRIVKDVMTQILDSCPSELRPRYERDTSAWVFPSTGSKIELYGFNSEEVESARGGKANLLILDECGFMNELRYGLQSVLIPKLNTTRGSALLCSTLPKSRGHEFYEIIKESEYRGLYVSRDIYTCPRFTDDDIQRFADEVGGMESVAFRREYRNIPDTDEEYAVIPEANDELMEKIVIEHKQPTHFDSYVSMDIGVKDLTFVLFGYLDFIKGALIIEEELIFKGRGFTTTNLALAVERKERELWNYKRPLIRVADNNSLILLNDLNIEFGLSFIPTAKDNKHAWINQLRVMLSEERIIINPRCKNLVFHLKNAVWNKHKTDYERSLDGGHYDGCFVAGTKVITSNGEKNIEDIKVGDSVLTHTGVYKPVLNTMVRNYKGDLIKVKPVGRNEILCTPNHEFFASSFKKVKNRDTYIESNWVSAEKLDNSNKLNIPLIQSVDEVKVTKELCFLYGYYVAEGNLGGNGSQIQLAGHIKETKVVDIIEKAVKDNFLDPKGTSRRSISRHKLGIFKPREIKATIFSHKPGNGRVIGISCKELYDKLKELRSGTEKRFPDFIKSLNKEQATYMLLGYLFGDGHFSSTGVKVGSISEHIKYGVDILSRIIGITPRIVLAKRLGRWKSSMNAKDQWICSFTKHDSLYLHSFINEHVDLKHLFTDKLIYPITLKFKRHYLTNMLEYKKELLKDQECLVYNFEVQDDNSYTVNGIAVHNCDALAYMIRNVMFHKNPYPKGYGIIHGDSALNWERTEHSDFQKGLINLFSPKKLK